MQRLKHTMPYDNMPVLCEYPMMFTRTDFIVVQIKHGDIEVTHTYLFLLVGVTPLGEKPNYFRMDQIFQNLLLHLEKTHIYMYDDGMTRPQTLYIIKNIDACVIYTRHVHTFERFCARYTNQGACGASSLATAGCGAACGTAGGSSPS